jgi:outer membrane protein
MKKLLITLAAAALAAPMFAQSAPTRIAVIDVQKVLLTSAPGKAASERLKKIQDERVARGTKMAEEAQALDNEINTKKLSLSEDKLTDLNKQLADKKIAIQRFGQDAEREVTEARDKTLLDLQNKILPVIDGIGKEMGLAIIFNKFESGAVYASDAIDITDTVIKRFNETSATATPAATKK